jgi:hypothetical protein
VLSGHRLTPLLSNTIFVSVTFPPKLSRPAPSAPIPDNASGATESPATGGMSKYTQQFAALLPDTPNLCYHSFDQKLVRAFPIIVRDPVPPPGGWKSLTDQYLAERGLQRLGGPVVSVDTVSSSFPMEEEEKQANAPSAIAHLVQHRSPSASPMVVPAVEEKKPCSSAVRAKSTAAPAHSAVAAKQQSLQPTPPAPRLAYTRSHSSVSSANAFRLVLRPVTEPTLRKRSFVNASSTSSGATGALVLSSLPPGVCSWRRCCWIKLPRLATAAWQCSGS